MVCSGASLTGPQQLGVSCWYGTAGWETQGDAMWAVLRVPVLGLGSVSSGMSLYWPLFPRDSVPECWPRGVTVTEETS